MEKANKLRGESVRPPGCVNFCMPLQMARQCIGKAFFRPEKKEQIHMGTARGYDAKRLCECEHMGMREFAGGFLSLFPRFAHTRTHAHFMGGKVATQPAYNVNVPPLCLEWNLLPLLFTISTKLLLSEACKTGARSRN